MPVVSADDHSLSSAQAEATGQQAPAISSTRPAATRLFERARRRLYDARLDLAIVAALTVLAATLRLWHLGTVPLGLHGDEAWTGLDAQRVLREGWIGPYVTSALGQPTGPLYFTALLFKVLPETTFTVRLSMAIFGILTIPLAYLAFRAMFGRTAGVFAAVILCLMTWHLQLTRTGFMVGAWPFIEMTVLWSLCAGLRRRSVPLLALAGALTGAGVYTYNAYLLFVPVVGVAIIWALFRRMPARDRVLLSVGSAALVAAAILVALPMIAYVDAHGATYRAHRQDVSVTNTAKWKDAGLGGKVTILRHRFDEWGQALVEGDRPDFGDGLAADGHPVVNPIIALLALGGISMALWRWRRTEYATVLAATAILPFGALLTFGDGLFRRSFGLAPFVAVLAALPLAWLWERGSARGGARGMVACGLLGVLVAYPGAVNVRDYFGSNQDTPAMRITYPYQDDAASHYVAGLPAGTVVYWYSDRWSFTYETRRFIAPDATGLDRSHEFGGPPTDQPLDFGADRTQDVAFVFLGSYLDNATKVQELYPGGTLSEGHRGSEATFRGYYLPAER